MRDVLGSAQVLQRLAIELGSRRYIDATREVLQAHGSLWFLDESYVISRKRD